MDADLKEQFLDNLKLKLEELNSEKQFMEHCIDLLTTDDELLGALLIKEHEERQSSLNDRIIDQTVDGALMDLKFSMRRKSK